MSTAPPVLWSARPPASPWPLSHCGNNYALPYRALRRLLALSEARGYEPESSTPRNLLALLGWWFEPLEDSVDEARQAREEFIGVGDLGNAAYTLVPTVRALLECAPSLDACVAELDAGLAFVRRIGSANMVEVLETYQWVIDALRGERPTATGGPASIAGYSDTPATLLSAYSVQAMAAAIFGDQAALERHTAEAVPLVSASPTEYPGAVARALRGLALAGQIRATDGAAREHLLSELDEVTRWLADRAADAPQNFLHLLRLLEAERAWAVGDFQGSVRGFDAALLGAGQRPRPWHRALITERAARFYLAHGIDHHGYDLLAQARQQYAAWGATAKVAQLDWAYPSLPPHQDTSAAQRNTRSPDDSLGRQWQCQHRNHRSAGHPVDVTGAELRNQHRRIARPGGAGTRRHDRRYRCGAAGLE